MKGYYKTALKIRLTNSYHYSTAYSISKLEGGSYISSGRRFTSRSVNCNPCLKTFVHYCCNNIAFYFRLILSYKFKVIGFYYY